MARVSCICPLPCFRVMIYYFSPIYAAVESRTISSVFSRTCFVVEEGFSIRLMSRSLFTAVQNYFVDNLAGSVKE